MNHVSPESEHLAAEQRHALIDDELSASEAEELERHLAQCHPCALAVLAASRLKAATARAGQRYTASPETLDRLAAQLRPPAPRLVERRSLLAVGRPVFLAWGALAATLLLAVSLVSWRQVRQTNTLSAELLDQHLSTLSNGAVPEVVSTDRHTVKPWFQGKLPFSFNLPEGLPADMALLGGDLSYLNGQPAALLLFRIHKHEVSVFLTERSRNAVRVPAGIHSGFAIRTAGARDLSITAVSDVNPTELDLLVTALAAAQ